ncbi:MAG: ABC transporter permease subunit [Ktedonobacteraceae bacterium]|nr:ABC transporter permease subunit [Ktedonobacteraceae bacterium]
MASNLFRQTTLQPVQAAGWRSGLANLWRKESQHWQQTWLWQAVIWASLLSGFTAIAGFASHRPALPASPASPGILMLMFLFFILFTSFGTVIMVHSKLLDEQQSGTMAWILSKPVTRAAFLLSKFAALPGMLLTMTVIPGVIAYPIIWLFTGQMPSPLTFLLILVFNASTITFFYCLTLLLGVLLKKRVGILALGLFLCFVLMQALFNNNANALLLIAHVLWLQLAAAALLTIALLCFLLALWRFTRQEF